MSTYGLWLSAAGMKVNEHRQAILANNMANANTTGFKRDLAVITQRRVESRAAASGSALTHPILDDLPGGIEVEPAYTNFGPGPIERTGRPLDVAIVGDGFLAVRDGTETRYTRDGEFAVNAAGELVLSAGEGRWKVLDDHGAAIVLPETGGPVSVSTDGTIHRGNTPVAKLGVMTTDRKQLLRKVGGNLFDAGKAEMVPVRGRFEPKSREESNFDVMRGLAAMIEASRAYQFNAKLIQLQDRMTGEAVTTVGRLVA